MPYVIRPEDRTSFKRCRRAWDLGSRSRQSYEPTAPAWSFDLGEAIRDALAVYYFPGMWEWNRQIVLPLVHDAFDKSVARQRARADALTDAQETDLQAQCALGHRMLGGYFEWAPSVDRFWPVRVETDFFIQIPDPWNDRHDLVSPTAGEIRYEGRIAMLVIDEADAYWVIDHRVVHGGWADVNELLLDEQGVSFCWAWEIFYLGMRIAGTIYNELRADVVPAAVQATPVPAGRVAQHRRMYVQATQEPAPGVSRVETDAFRRTRIPRSRAELDHMGSMIALEAMEMTDPGLHIYPSASPDHCPACSFRRPCVAMNEGADTAAILGSAYQLRPPEQVEEGRLGGQTWSMNRGAMPLASRARERQRLPKEETQP
ncbi:MAG: hypothetical protein ACRDZ4_22340 [Egibacteraceae bacterium]